MRRHIERLRAGKVRGLDPRIPPLLLADLMELSLEREIITRSVIADMDDQRDLERKINARLYSERFRRSVAGFHTLKKSPEAADPESPAAEKVRRLNRERRNDLGRPRKRRRKRSRGVHSGLAIQRDEKQETKCLTPASLPLEFLTPPSFG